ncbi:hypothetical protein TEA_004592 [Camellia sinensis var. sinensis]|uniref:C3H1-type domain-containing protein n=1 Tax=Camellia sinensis var. sinensis TaxID=542762 RepID=A0A4V6RY76_CAMSN|nr:hypothetical protein TEA_004592 [Camellia sinensis var. sinensis]
MLEVNCSQASKNKECLALVGLDWFLQELWGLNLWVLSPKYFNFPFPITLTMIHMGFSGVVAFFLVRVFKYGTLKLSIKLKLSHECLKLYKLGFCPNGPDCRYRHAKLPGPPPPVEEVLQKIQQMTSYNYGNSNRFFQNRNSNYPQQTEKPQFPQGPNAANQATAAKSSTTESPNMQLQQQVQQSQQQVGQTQIQNFPNGQQNQGNKSSTPLPQGISRCVQSSKSVYRVFQDLQLLATSSQRTKRFQLVCYASKPQPPLRFIKTMMKSRITGSSGVDAASIGYIGDEWDEEYDKGKRKKVRCSQIEFGGPNPFQEIATKKTTLKKVKTDQYATCVIPISAFFASSLWFGNTAYLHISVAFIQMLKALMPVATFVMAVLCGTDKLRWDVFLNMVLVSVGVVVSSYGEIHFNVVGTVYQVTGIFAEALRLVLTQVLLQKKGLTLNPITSLYYIAPCSFMFLFVPWFFLENPGMEVSQIQFNFWIFFSNAICALALNFSIFLVIGRTGAVTIRVAGVLKDWILIALSTVVFPESTITGLNIIGYAIALCGVVMYNYLKVQDVRSSQLPADSIPERITKDWKSEKSSDILRSDSSNDNNRGSSGGNNSGSDLLNVDEEVPLIPLSRLSHIGRTQLSSHGV